MPDFSHIEPRLPIVQRLAKQALDMAVDASPTKPREGEHVRSLMEWVPLAKRLLETPSHKATGLEPSPFGTDPQEAYEDFIESRFLDGRGHSRPHYGLLAAGINTQPWDEETEVSERSEHAAALALAMDDRFEIQWLVAAAMRPDLAGDYTKVALNFAPLDGPLHAPDADVSPDEWVFSEMVALHGLFKTAINLNDQALNRRAASAARYHLHHTQPDYTTYQPWALAAFLYFPDTVGFAEQQLHDVETHLHVEGPPGALVPGLLLADAVATLREAMKRDAG